MMSLVRRARQQQEWEERQAERKARQAEMAGEPFDKEVGQLSLVPFNSRQLSMPSQMQHICHFCWNALSHLSSAAMPHK